MQDSMLILDLTSLLCAVYCTYTWLRLLKARALFANSLLLPKGKQPSDCLDEEGYVAYILPRLGVLSLLLLAYSGVLIVSDLLQLTLLTGLWSLLPTGLLLAVIAWYAVISVKAIRTYF